MFMDTYKQFFLIEFPVYFHVLQELHYQCSFIGTLLAFVGICIVILWSMASIILQIVVVLVNRVLSDGSRQEA